MIPTLETERLVLRAPTEADFPPFRDFYAGPRSHFVGGPLTAEMAWRMLAMEIGHWWLKGFGRFIVAERATGTPVGLVGPRRRGASPRIPSAPASASIAPAIWACWAPMASFIIRAGSTTR